MNLNECKLGTAMAVSDMDDAIEFYEGKLGLSAGQETGDGGRTYQCGEGTSLHIFPSADAGGTGATTAAWAVDDIEAVVDELTSRGVSFEKYDQPPVVTDEKGIVALGDARGAYMKDPAGNVLALGEGF